jgi:hypothetical protein
VECVSKPVLSPVEGDAALSLFLAFVTPFDTGYALLRMLVQVSFLGPRR